MYNGILIETRVLQSREREKRNSHDTAARSVWWSPTGTGTRPRRQALGDSAVSEWRWVSIGVSIVMGRPKNGWFVGKIPSVNGYMMQSIEDIEI